MNLKVSPVTKNVGLLKRKSGVFLEMNGEIPSLIKVSEKVMTANYDLSLLDVVPMTTKAPSPRTKHVHFSSDKTKISSRKSEALYGNSRKDVAADKTDIHSTCSQQRLEDSTKGHNRQDTRIKIDGQSLTKEISKPHGRRSSARRGCSLNAQKNHDTLVIHRSDSVPAEESSQYQSGNKEYQMNCLKEKENIRTVKSKDSRTLPKTPVNSTKSHAPIASVTVQRSTNHKPPVGSRKDSVGSLSVHFADSISLPNLKNELVHKRDNDTNAELLKKKEQNSPLHSETNKKINAKVMTQPHKTEPEVTKSQVNVSNDSISLHLNLCGTEDNRRIPRRKTSTSSFNKSDINNCSPRNYGAHSTSQVPSVSVNEHFIGRQPHFNQLESDPYFENQYLTDNSSSLTSTSLKRVDELQNDSSYEVIVDTPISAPSSSASSSYVNNDITSKISSDFSSAISTRSHNRTFPENRKEASTKSGTFLAPTPPVSSIKSKLRRSSSCFSRDYIFKNSLDYVTTKHQAQNDVHSSSPSSNGLHRDARLPNSGPNSSSTFGTSFDQNSLPQTSTKYDNLVSRKENIAASYQLEYCWFCGRPMPIFGISASSCEEHLQVLAELERRLAQVQLEKIKLVEEQVKLKESEVKILLKTETLEKELEQVKLREKDKQKKDESRYARQLLPNTSKDFDLRAHIDMAGHQLDMCPHIILTSQSCRGFLHKVGGRFKTWKKRWFVLDRTKRMVFYFKDKTENKLKGSICFQAIEDVYVDHLRTVKTSNPKLTFCMKTYERTYYLVAPSFETMTIWIDVLFSGAEGYQHIYDIWSQTFSEQS